MERHPADLVSLASGIAFAAAGLVLVSGGVELLALEWVAPLAVIVIGALFIVAARSSRTTPA
jgi:hypothetical protein